MMEDDCVACKDKKYRDKMKLNLGCGNDIREGYTNVDLYNPSADVEADLNGELPFEDFSVDEIYCSHIIEHLKDPQAFLWECWRVLKPRGKLVILYPYAFSEYGVGNPDHRHLFGLWSFENMRKDEGYPPFKEIARNFGFCKVGRVINKIFPEKLSIYLSLYLGHIVKEVEVKMKTETYPNCQIKKDGCENWRKFSKKALEKLEGDG